jgi:hypothetical protein
VLEDKKMKWVKNKYLYLLLIMVLTITSVNVLGVSICFADTMTDQEIVDSAKTALVLTTPEEWVSANLTLPATGENGTTIAWASNQTGYITNDGVLLRQPTYNEGLVTVNFTATISFGTASTTKVFPITIRPTPNIVLNYGFEDGVNNWSRGFPSADGVATISNDVYHNGRASVIIPRRSVNWGRYTYNLPANTPLIAGKMYITSVWVKIKDWDNEPATSTMQLISADGPGTNFSSAIPYNNYAVNINKEWKEIKGAFVSKDGKSGEVVQIMTYSNFQYFTYYLDDFTIQPIVPYNITATGATNITIPVGSNVKNENYTYNIVNQLGTTDYIGSEKAVWSVEGNPVGVSIEPNTGKLQVGATATEGIVTVRATSNSYDWLKKDIKVELQNMPAMPPTAKNVQVTTSTSFETPGISTVGDTLTASYQYDDENLDAESGSTYKWIATNSESSITGEVIGSGDISSATNVTYTVKQTDVGKYIKFIVTPRSQVMPQDGIETGGNAILIQAAPSVKDVKIVGTPAVGTELYGSYNFSHPNGYLELGSTYRWISGDQVIGTGATYTVTASDAGKSIYFEVTPASMEEPRVGVPVASQAVSIPQASSGRGGSGSRSGGTSITVVKPVETAKPTPTPPVTTSISFGDLDDHWAKAEVEQLVEKGIIKGKDAEKFAPDLSITRAEFATIIARALGLKQTKYNHSFRDVDANSWYADDLQTVSDSKLIAGNDGAFRPNDNITREEMAKIIVEAYKIMTEKELPQGNSIQFEDQDNMGVWAVEYINLATELGLINGIDNTHFDPKAVATRAQAAVIIKRLLDKK